MQSRSGNKFAGVIEEMVIHRYQYVKQGCCKILSDSLVFTMEMNVVFSLLEYRLLLFYEQPW